MNDTYTAPSGEVVRVVGNNLLVLIDEESKTTRGGLVIPDTALRSLHLTGKVVAIGHLTGNKLAEKVSVPGLQIGDHVMFVRFLEKTDSNGDVQRVLGDKVVRIRPADVLLVMDVKEVDRVG